MVFGRRRQRQLAAESLDEAVTAVDEAQRAGVEVAALRVLCRGVEKRIAKRRYEEALRKAETVTRLTAKLAEEHRAASEAMTRLEEVLGRLRLAGVDVSEGEASLQEAATLFEGEKRVKGVPIPTYADAADVASAALVRHEEAASNVVKTRRALSVLLDSVREFREEQDVIQGPALMERLLGEPLTSAEEAERRLELGDHEVSLELATRALEEARGSVERARDSIERHHALGSYLTSLEAEGAPMSDMEGTLEEAGRLLREGELGPANDAMAALETRASGVRERYRDGLRNILAAEEAVAQADEWGFQTASQRTVIENARKALKRGRWSEADGLASRAREGASTIRETHRELTETINRLRASAEAENEGAVLPILEAADAAMMEGDYDRARAAIREVERRLSIN